MSVLYLGAHRIGILCLREILRRRVPVSLVVARYGDRGGGVAPFLSLRNYARRRHLPNIQPRDINTPAVVQRIRRLQPRWIISVQYDQILNKEVLESAPHKVNLHFAALPKNRGCFPVPWALIDAVPAGVTLHVIDRRIDTGDILAQRRFRPGPKETALSVYKRVEQLAASLFVQKFFTMYARQQYQGTPQHTAEATYHSLGYPYDRYVNWEWDVRKIDRFVRALTFPPFPSARTQLGGREVEILHPVRLVRASHGRAKMGEVTAVRRHFVRIKARGGVVEIRKVKMDGRPIRIETLMYRLHLRAGMTARKGPTRA